MSHITVTPSDRLPQLGDDVLIGQVFTQESDYWYFVDNPTGPFTGVIATLRTEITTVTVQAISIDRTGQSLSSPVYAILTGGSAQYVLATGFSSLSDAESWIYQNAIHWMD